MLTPQRHLLRILVPNVVLYDVDQDLRSDLSIKEILGILVIRILLSQLVCKNEQFC